MKSAHRITVEQKDHEDFKRRNHLKTIMKEHKTIPEILIESAEAMARDCRRETQGLKDRLRRNPLLQYTAKLIEFEHERLNLYEQDIKDMREFYGKAGILS